MAVTKLTLSVEPSTVEKARRYASKNKVSISRLFSDFINQVVNKDEVEEDLLLRKIKETEIPENIKAITGVLKGKLPDDFDYREAKYAYLKEKHGL